jgi:hypothetical protein
MAEVLEFKYESGSKEEVYFSSDMSGEGYTEEQTLLKKPIENHGMYIIIGLVCAVLSFCVFIGFFMWIVVCAQIRMHNNSTNYTTNFCI